MKVPKLQCEICWVKSRTVKEVKAFGRRKLMCDKCIRVADKMPVDPNYGLKRVQIL